MFISGSDYSTSSGYSGSGFISTTSIQSPHINNDPQYHYNGIDGMTEFILGLLCITIILVIVGNVVAIGVLHGRTNAMQQFYCV